MTVNPADVLDAASRCLLAVRARRGPRVTPKAHWFDGDAVWLTVADGSVEAATLRRDGECALAVPARGEVPAVTATASVRVFGPDEPVALALHGPTISAALWALAGRNLGTLADKVTRLRPLPPRPVVVRASLTDLASAPPPPSTTGMAPGLPAELPADLRRRLGGHRQLMVAWDAPPLRMLPASWGQGRRLKFASAGPVPAAGERLAVALDDEGQRASDAVGAVLHGRLDDAGALQPDRITWWRGLAVTTDELPPPSSNPPPVQLPD